MENGDAGCQIHGKEMAGGFVTEDLKFTRDSRDYPYNVLVLKVKILILAQGEINCRSSLQRLKLNQHLPLPCPMSLWVVPVYTATAYQHTDPIPSLTHSLAAPGLPREK